MNSNSKPSSMFPTCRTDDGRIIPASLAEPGRIYHCFDRDCPCMVFKRISSSGTESMVTCRGQTHTGPICGPIVLNRKRGRSLKSTFSGGLERAILRPPRISTGVDDAPKEDLNDITNLSRPKSPRRNQEQTTAMRSLAELDQFGITRMENCLLFDNVYTTDLFISEKHANILMRNHNDLGPRGLEVRLEYALDSMQAIRFVIWATEHVRSTYPPRQKVMDMVFSDYQEYNRARNRLFETNPNTNSKIRYIPKFSGTVYVYGIWIAVDRSKDKCKQNCRRWCSTKERTCVGRYYAQGINDMTQIYIPPKTRHHQ